MLDPPTKEMSCASLIQFRFSGDGLQGAGGWPMNGILAAVPRLSWHLDPCGAWKPWIDGLKWIEMRIPRFAGSSGFPLDFRIYAVRQNVFFSLSGSLWTWLEYRYPVHRQSHGRVEMLCLCLSAEDRWTDWESGNKTHLNHSQHVMAS